MVCPTGGCGGWGRHGQTKEVVNKIRQSYRFLTVAARYQGAVLPNLPAGPHIQLSNNYWADFPAQTKKRTQLRLRYRLPYGRGSVMYSRGSVKYGRGLRKPNCGGP